MFQDCEFNKLSVTARSSRTAGQVLHGVDRVDPLILLLAGYPRLVFPLEYLCVSCILAAKGTSKSLLPHLPPGLYPAVIHAVLQDDMLKTSAWDRTWALRWLLSHWPHSTLTIRDVIPKHYEVPYRTIIQGRQQTFFGFKKKMMHPMEETLSLITSIFLSRNYLKDAVSGPLTRLDISGLPKGLLGSHTMKTLEKQVKKALKHNTPLDFGQRELVVDLVLLTPSSSQRQSFLRLVVQAHELSEQRKAGLSVRFPRVLVSGTVAKEVLPLLSHLASKGTQCMELEGPERLSRTLRSYEDVDDKRRIISLDFLQGSPLLQLLSFHEIDLRGKCGALKGLPAGLQYLKMAHCSLAAADLDELCSSKHAESLYQLDIHNNNFGGSLEIASLCMLCCCLQKVTVLNVEACELNFASPKCLSKLVQSLVKMPALILLKLERNSFSSASILNMVELGASQTLCKIDFSTPPDTISSLSLRDRIYGIIDYQIDNKVKCLGNAFHQGMKAFQDPPPEFDIIFSDLHKWFWK